MNREFSNNSSPETRGNLYPSFIEQGFAIDNFESDLRSRQRMLFEGISLDDNESMGQASLASDQLAFDYVTHLGVLPDPTDDTSRHTELYETARRYSYHTMSEEEWHEGIHTPTDPEALPLPGCWRLQAEQSRLFGHQIMPDGSQYVAGHRTPPPSPNNNTPSNPNNSHENEQDISLEDLEIDIRLARMDSGRAFAERMKAGFFTRKSKKLEMDQRLEEKETELNELLAERDRLLAAQFVESMSEEQVAEEMAAVMNNDADREGLAQRKAMIGESLRGKALDWYANRKRWEKVSLGLFAAAGGAAIGATIGAGAGVVGGGILVGTRLVRAYSMQRAKLYETPEEPEPISYIDEEGRIKTVEEMTKEAADRRAEIVDQRIEKGEKIKKWAAITTLGSTALIGYGIISEHIDVVGDITEKTKSGIGRVWDYVTGGDDAKAMPIKLDPIVPGPGEGPKIIPDAPPLPEAVPSFDASQFHDALTIDQTEGWYSTFEQAGIVNSGEQYAMLHNESLMSSLEEMGYAYRDTSVGGWGMNYGNGQLSQEALKLIRDSAAQNHYTLAR